MYDDQSEYVDFSSLYLSHRYFLLRESSIIAPGSSGAISVSPVFRARLCKNSMSEQPKLELELPRKYKI